MADNDLEQFTKVRREIKKKILLALQRSGVSDFFPFANITVRVRKGVIIPEVIIEDIEQS